MPPFHRGAFTELVLTLTSMEPLGLLQTDYVEDVDGVDGQVTLRLPGGEARALLVTGLDSGHERFRAFVPLAGLPDGPYRVQGRVRDVVGNVAALDLAFELAAGLGTVVQVPGLSVVGVLSVEPMPVPARPTAPPALALSTGLPLPPPMGGRTLPARRY